MTFPEHVEKILTWQDDQAKAIKPIIDEQQSRLIFYTWQFGSPGVKLHGEFGIRYGPDVTINFKMY